MKKFELTPSHMAILRAMCEFPVGSYQTTFQISDKAKFYGLAIWTVRAYLISLRKQGYVASKKYRNSPQALVFWSLGPLSDQLKEQGLLD